MELRGLLRRERWRGGDQPGHMLVQRPVIPLLGAQRVIARAVATQVGCSLGERLARGTGGDTAAANAVIPAASAEHSAPAPACAAQGASRPLCGTASSPPASSLLAGTHTGTGTGTGTGTKAVAKAVADAVPHTVPGEVVVGGGEVSSDPALSAYAESVGHEDEPWTSVPGRGADDTESSFLLSAAPAA